MAKLIKTEVESLPRMKLIGRRYDQNDRDAYGTFSEKWGECFAEGMFDKLMKAVGPEALIEGISADYIGLMRMEGEGFEYRIGIFVSPDAKAPLGYDEVTVEAGNVFTCYIYGKDSTGELYGEAALTACTEALKASGHHGNIKNWEFERYNCPRFTEPDAEGNVILDYCMYIDD